MKSLHDLSSQGLRHFPEIGVEVAIYKITVGCWWQQHRSTVDDDGGGLRLMREERGRGDLEGGTEHQQQIALPYQLLGR